MGKVYRNADDAKAEPAKMKRTAPTDEKLKAKREKYRRNEKRWVRKSRYFKQK